MRGDRASRSTPPSSAGARATSSSPTCPFLRGKGIAQYTSDPVFQRLLDEEPRPSIAGRRAAPAACARSERSSRAHPQLPGAVCARPRRARRSSASSRSTRARRSPGTTCRSCASGRSCRSCSRASCTPTTRAARSTHGMDGIVVSNHGGRQVDGSIATLDALPGVAEAVDGRIPVLLDSGVRGGADVFKALALGATAVLHRPALRLRARGRRRGGRARGAPQLHGRLRPDDGTGRLRARSPRSGQNSFTEGSAGGRYNPPPTRM